MVRVFGRSALITELRVRNQYESFLHKVFADTSVQCDTTLHRFGMDISVDDLWAGALIATPCRG
jgi:hypothetical protein